MHGKGSFAVLLLVAALAAPPTLYYRVWNAEIRSENPAPPPPVVERAEPVPLTPPPPIKAAPPPEVDELIFIERDPMLSLADRERLKPAPPEPAPVPVAPPPAPQPRPERLAVQGVVAVEGQARKAIINGRETAVGEKVGRAKVVGIDLDGVTFQRRGRTFKKKVGD